MTRILITGGSGLIGGHLTRALRTAGHEVAHLGRRAGNRDGVRTYTWDLYHGRVEEGALEGVDHIVHLAGAGIADRRWNPDRIKELTDSRAANALLLLRTAKRRGVTPKSFISSAGANYFGAVTTDHVFTEDDPPGADTIARISVAWERAVDEWSARCRVVKLRTPIVLAREGGALPKLALPVRYGLGAALGHGRQWMPWVHIDDLVAAYMKALTDETMSGVYHVCAAEHVTNAAFMRTMARVLHRPFLLPNAPAWALRAALGEMAALLLDGSRVGSSRLRSTGFQFRHDALEPALADLLKR
ncbi:MAG: TIGR01777 family oxidoreductase [Flavobacteriales bacterium]|nr:TIGR01777 family oxidoreductase [Flavobacteriales bacterium]